MNSTRKAIAVTLALGVSMTTAACGGGGGSGSTPPVQAITASFQSSGTPADADLVWLAGAAASDVVTVRVVVGGATTDDDLYSFAFDLVVGNPAVAEFVPNSAAAGTALEAVAGQQIEVLADQVGDRIRIGVSKLGGGSGNAVADPEAVVVSLRVRVISRGSSSIRLEGSPPNDPAVLDSAGQVIPTISFDAASAGVGGS